MKIRSSFVTNSSCASSIDITIDNHTSIEITVNTGAEKLAREIMLFSRDTLLVKLRLRHLTAAGDTLTLIELRNGIIVMRPGCSQLDDIADHLAEQWNESGETLETMLSA